MGRKDQMYGDVVDPADKEIVEPCISLKATLHQELPEPVIEVLQKHNIRIRLDKTNISKLFDQMPGMVARDGCISSPSGPSC